MTPTEYDRPNAPYREFSLAERCYLAGYVEQELFETVALILGSDPEKCLDEGFKWQVSDCWWDEYDCSIEVIRQEDCEQMTREQADQILALGFGQIYESCGTVGRQITKSYMAPCNSRETKSEEKKLRAEVNILRKLIPVPA